MSDAEEDVRADARWAQLLREVDAKLDELYDDDGENPTTVDAAIKEIGFRMKYMSREDAPDVAKNTWLDIAARAVQMARRVAAPGKTE